MRHLPASQNTQNMYGQTPNFSQQARVNTYHPLMSPQVQPRKPGMRLDPEKLMDAESPANRRMITRDLMKMCHEVDRRAHKERDFAAEKPLDHSEFQLLFQKILNPTQVLETEATQYRPTEEGGIPQVDVQENTFNYSRQKTIPREPTIESMIQASHWDANASPMMGARSFVAPEGHAGQKSGWSNDISKSLFWNSSPIQTGAVTSGQRQLQQLAVPHHSMPQGGLTSRASSAMGSQYSHLQVPQERLFSSPTQGDISPQSDYMDIGTPEVTHNLNRRFQTLKVSTVNPRLLHSARATTGGSGLSEYGGFGVLR